MFLMLLMVRLKISQDTLHKFIVSSIIPLILSDEIDKKINFTDVSDVETVSEDVVKKAAKHLKNNKSDPVFDFSSDCLSNGPDVMFCHLSMILNPQSCDCMSFSFNVGSSHHGQVK